MRLRRLPMVLATASTLVLAAACSSSADSPDGTAERVTVLPSIAATSHAAAAGSAAPPHATSAGTREPSAQPGAGAGIVSAPAESARQRPQPTGDETPPPTDDSAPTLGTPWAPNQGGYGTAEPAEIDNGGDPTGIVKDVTWSGWGQSRATGHGTSYYVAPGKSVAESVAAPTTVVAFDLGDCNGKRVYRAVEWYFPGHGQTFNPSQYIDICTGKYVG